VLKNARDIVEATHLPVSADLANGFGRSPESCAEVIGLAAEVGLVGGSIEDASGDPGEPIYPFDLAVERVAAAVGAAKDRDFLLTARAENFEAAGADVLYAPGLLDLEAIREVCSAVSKPVNVVMGLSGGAYTVAQLADAGVKRISVGGSMARAALGGLVRAAQEIREQGTFTFAADALTHAEATRFMDRNA
jgi:2-methylisocitrate lyase-like PEP mutase family enzyme